MTANIFVTFFIMWTIIGAAFFLILFGTETDKSLNKIFKNNNRKYLMLLLSGPISFLVCNKLWLGDINKQMKIGKVRETVYEWFTNENK